jgi:hypothetical protein
MTSTQVESATFDLLPYTIARPNQLDYDVPPPNCHIDYNSITYYYYYQYPYSHFLGFGLLFSYLILYTVAITFLMEDQPFSTYTQYNKNKHRSSSKPRLGFKPTISMFEWANIILGLAMPF